MKRLSLEKNNSGKKTSETPTEVSGWPASYSSRSWRRSSPSPTSRVGSQAQALNRCYEVISAGVAHREYLFAHHLIFHCEKHVSSAPRSGATDKPGDRSKETRQLASLHASSALAYRLGVHRVLTYRFVGGIVRHTRATSG